MRYVLRVWMNDRLEETKISETAAAPLLRFREIVAEWPRDWRHARWSVTVNAEPGPYPVHSFPIASYHHVPDAD